MSAEIKRAPLIEIGPEGLDALAEAIESDNYAGFVQEISVMEWRGGNHIVPAEYDAPDFEEPDSTPQTKAERHELIRCRLGWLDAQLEARKGLPLPDTFATQVRLLVRETFDFLEAFNPPTTAETLDALQTAFDESCETELSRQNDSYLERALAAERALGASGNYVADTEIEPREVTFANGRVVRVVGDGYLVVERTS